MHNRSDDVLVRRTLKKLGYRVDRPRALPKVRRKRARVTHGGWLALLAIASVLVWAGVVYGVVDQLGDRIASAFS